MTKDIGALPEVQASVARQATRQWPTFNSGVGGRVTVDGRSILMFGSNDYLGLAGHPEVTAAAARALDEYGVGTGMNPVLGVTAVHRELMERMREFTGCEDVLLFNSCTAANCALVPTLVGEQDATLSDELNHASIIDACRLSKGRTVVYQHGDVGSLAARFADVSDARVRLVITDGMFSMEGDPAPLREITRVSAENGALVAIDESHAAGVIGASGRGTAELFGLERTPPIQTGTFSKAFGAGLGGYVAGPKALIDHLRDRARFFIFTSGMPASLAAAAVASLGIIRREPERLARLRANTERFRAGMRELGFELLGGAGPIVPVLVRDEERTHRLGTFLLQRGAYLPAMTHPIVRNGEGRLRAQLSASHTDEQIDETLELFAAAARAVAS